MRKGMRSLRDLTTPSQGEKIKGKENRMSLNDAGGMTFDQDAADVFYRQLLAIPGQAYYVSEGEGFKRQLYAFSEMYKTYGPEAYAKLIAISAPNAFRPHGILLALAWAMQNFDAAHKRYVEELIAPDKVVRTLNYLYEYVEATRQVGKKSSYAKRKVIANWLLMADELGKLEYQSAKYFSRIKWSVWDLLRLSHPKHPKTENFVKIVQDIKAWAKGERDEQKFNTRLYKLHARAISLKNNPIELARLIETEKLFRELIPDEARHDPRIAWALAQHAPSLAFVKSLPELASAGALFPGVSQERIDFVIQKINSAAKTLHPIDLAIAAIVYKSGHTMRRNFNPISAISHALSDATIAAFNRYRKSDENVFRGKTTFIAVDTSGSMRRGDCNGVDIPPIKMAAVMAKLVGGMADSYVSGTFSDDFLPHQYDLTDGISAIAHNFNKYGACCGTNAASAIEWLKSSGKRVDLTVMITDGQAWEGSNADAVLDNYRTMHNVNMPLFLINMQPGYGNSLFDPKNPLNFWFNGFDASIARVLELAVSGQLSNDYIQKFISG